MKSVFFAVCVVLAAASLGIGQQSPASGAHASAFNWRTSDGHELGMNDRIKVQTNLNPEDRSVLIDEIASLLRPGMSELDIQSEKELHSIAADTRIKLIDLNGDGKDEIIAQATGLKAGCGATGNCPFWIFEKSLKGYRVLFDADAAGRDMGYVQVFSVESNRTNGFQDIVLGSHDSATERTLYLLRFRNGKYREEECYDADLEDRSRPVWKDLKKPIITPCAVDSALVK